MPSGPRTSMAPPSRPSPDLRANAPLCFARPQPTLLSFLVNIHNFAHVIFFFCPTRVRWPKSQSRPNRAPSSCSWGGGGAEMRTRTTHAFRRLVLVVPTAAGATKPPHSVQKKKQQPVPLPPTQLPPTTQTQAPARGSSSRTVVLAEAKKQQTTDDIEVQQDQRKRN